MSGVSIFPTLEVFRMCTCGKENPQMIINSDYIKKFQLFLDSNGVNEELKRKSLDGYPSSKDDLNLCCKVRCTFGNVYAIPVENSQRTVSNAERSNINILPGPGSDQSMFTYPCRNSPFVYSRSDAKLVYAP